MVLMNKRTKNYLHYQPVVMYMRYILISLEISQELNKSRESLVNFHSSTDGSIAYLATIKIHSKHICRGVLSVNTNVFEKCYISFGKRFANKSLMFANQRKNFANEVQIIQFELHVKLFQRY